MVSETRKNDLEDIANLEQFLNKTVKDEPESKELFSKENIEVKTDLDDQEISIIARLKFLCDELDLENFRKSLTYLMELKVSKGRKSRKEFIDSIKKQELFNNGNNNMGGFMNGRSS